MSKFLHRVFIPFNNAIQICFDVIIKFAREISHFYRSFDFFFLSKPPINIFGGEMIKVASFEKRMGAAQILARSCSLTEW
jgi:hypothetical protein